MTIGKPPNADDSLSPISFRLDPGSGVPTFIQLVQQVEHALSLGYLKRGDQLPRIKDVVTDLVINPNTVLKAYRSLEQKGLVKGRPGQGTFVLASPETLSLRQYTALRKKLADGWLRGAFAAGLDDSTIAALMQDTLREESEERINDKSNRDGGEVVA
jgi:GntR family transcriptional regulator